MRYNLSLLNVDQSLDLVPETNTIRESINKILTGGVNGNKYGNVTFIKILRITKRNIQLECIEKNKDWHMHLGHELANNFDMREFCYTDVQTSNSNKEIMFKWS